MSGVEHAHAPSNTVRTKRTHELVDRGDAHDVASRRETFFTHRSRRVVHFTSRERLASCIDRTCGPLRNSRDRVQDGRRRPRVQLHLASQGLLTASASHRSPREVSRRRP